MPRATPIHHHTFDHLLDARIGGEHQAAAPSEATPSPQVRQILFGMQESWKEAADASAADLAQLYEADAQSMAPARGPQGSDLETVADELGLTSDLTVEELNRIRRDFALANHPDRVASALAGQATRRMTAANTLIDRALQRKRNQSA